MRIKWFHQICVKHILDEKVLWIEMSFMLYRLSDTYLFDNYNKYVILLLNYRLDLSWLGLEKKSLFPVSLYPGYRIYFNNQEFTYSFLNIFSCVISNKECL